MADSRPLEVPAPDTNRPPLHRGAGAALSPHITVVYVLGRMRNVQHTNDSEQPRTSLRRNVVMAFGATISLTIICAAVATVAFQIISGEVDTLREERLGEVDAANQLISETKPLMDSVDQMANARQLGDLSGATERFGSLASGLSKGLDRLPADTRDALMAQVEAVRQAGQVLDTVSTAR
mgnify:CR=1 FL=1